MMKKHFKFMWVILLITLIAAGCSSSSSTGPSGNNVVSKTFERETGCDEVINKMKVICGYDSGIFSYNIANSTDAKLENVKIELKLSTGETVFTIGPQDFEPVESISNYSQITNLTFETYTIEVTLNAVNEEGDDNNDDGDDNPMQFGKDETCEKSFDNGIYCDIFFNQESNRFEGRYINETDDITFSTVVVTVKLSDGSIGAASTVENMGPLGSQTFDIAPLNTDFEWWTVEVLAIQ
jgi:hypothetical protein